MRCTTVDLVCKFWCEQLEHNAAILPSTAASQRATVLLALQIEGKLKTLNEQLQENKSSIESLQKDIKAQTQGKEDNVSQDWNLTTTVKR